MNNMKSIIERVIARGGYDLNGLLDKIREFHVTGDLTDTDRDELMAVARGEAAPGMDVKNEIQRLWAAINDIREKLADKSGETEDSADESNVPEYAQPTGAHDAYYAGVLVRYNGKLYQCIAPQGVACVWNPDVMPGYWEEI